jgi:hypothetical protein
MPTIVSRTVPLATTDYEHAPAPSTPSLDMANNALEPGLNSNLRCTLPSIFAATDNLRQFYAGSTSPQYRLLPVQPLSK